MQPERCQHKACEGYRYGPPQHGGRSGTTRGSAAQASFPHLRQLMPSYALIATHAEGLPKVLRTAAVAH